MAELLNTDGTHRHVEPANGQAWTLAELRAFVGGSIEMVRISGTDALIINESGLLEDLPWNHVASRLSQIPIAGPALWATYEELGEPQLIRSTFSFGAR